MAPRPNARPITRSAPNTASTAVSASRNIAALPPAPGRADRRVQLGSVRSKARAQKEARRLAQLHKPLLDGLEIVLVRADLGRRGVFYRLRAGPLSNHAAAASLCRKLSARKQSCIVTKP